MAEQTKFSVLCSLFTWIQRSKSSAKKRSKFRKFIDTFCKSDDYFSGIRLILPNLDRERGTYGLKESVLATTLIDALSMSRESEDALRLINWRKGGAKAGANAGNFALVAAEVLQRRQGLASGGLTIKELNDLLDQLASSENRAEKILVLSTLIKKTNAQEMKWIVMIILKDLKLGISEKSIFHEFHPDAEDLFNVTCDLKLVCEKLKDRNQRHKRQDIEVGKAVRPQLAMRVADATAAWKRLHGKEVVVECKFDGDRIQIHKNKTEIHFFSRSFLDHSEYGPGMSDIIVQNILVDRCILDGEMLVWDKSLNRFAEFGSNQEIAKAAKDGLDSDRQLCYVAFDILYVGDTSVIHQSLKERHELLHKVVKPLKGRLEILVPNGGLNAHCPPGEPCRSLIAHNVDDVERFFKETIENRDEGIVLKDLGSKWEPSDRSGKWLKLKPDYIRAGSDLDVLIIGGYYGSGRRGGEVAQFLVGLAETPSPNTYPRRFISFCRVGTGLSDDELDALVTKLKPYFRKYDYPKKAPPSFYRVTNNSKERPDVWVDNPQKSIILSITCDIRTINSEVFAAPYSLRFPRIDRVRYDKLWHECLDVQSFVELVQSSNGTTQRGMDYSSVQDGKPKRLKSSKRGDKRNISVVPSHLIQTDVSNVKGDSLMFTNMMFFTHCIAADSKGFKFEAAKRHGDIIHYSWILDCCSQKKLVHLQPKYFLFLSELTKRRLREEIDEFSDSFYCDLDLTDLKQLLSNLSLSEDLITINYYKKKYCPKDKWSNFHGCCIYFHPSIPFPVRFVNFYFTSLKGDQDVLLGLVQRRLKLEVIMGGGRVSDSIAYATHVVVVSVPGHSVDSENILTSFPSMEKHFQSEQEVACCWISVANTEECKHDMAIEAPSGEDNTGDENMSPFLDKESKQTRVKAVDNRTVLASPERGGYKRRRGRPAGRGMKKAKTGSNQAQRARARIDKKPAKIREYETDEGDSYDEKSYKGDINLREGRYEKHPETQGTEIVEDFESSERGKEAQPAATVDDHNYSVLASSERAYKKRGRLSSRGEANLRQGTYETSPETQETTRVEDSDLSVTGKEAQQEVLDDIGHGNEYVPEIEVTERHNSQTSEKKDKLEIMADPVQAMLFDMIPSLGIKKVEQIVEHNHKDEKPLKNPNEQPIKKKKVSYRDIAGELLKD
ncbi:DNA ligase [Quillaja saponaria]|uniref:DNA ligase n=1 Tax=Quillaja saponaria TaxID=32244 RepID=A0AAD7QDA0_QUISA|nr:DNA ligase [Quillaja saponaria]